MELHGVSSLPPSGQCLWHVSLGFPHETCRFAARLKRLSNVRVSTKTRSDAPAESIELTMRLPVCASRILSVLGVG